MFTASDYGHRLDLFKLSKQHGDYNPKRCHALKLTVDGVRAMLWKSGKVQIMGAKSEKQALQVTERIAEMLTSSGISDVRVNDYRVLSVAATFSMGARIDVVKASRDLTGIYEPEISNSAVVPIRGGKLLIFPSGSVIAVGFSDEEIAMSSMLEAYMDLLDYIIE